MPNKSKAIREYKAANPLAMAREIAVALGEEGIEVSPAYVATVLCYSRKSSPVEVTPEELLLAGRLLKACELDENKARDCIRAVGAVKETLAG